MGKITKTNMAVTIDTWIYNWISNQEGKKSTLVNKILKDYIIGIAEEPKRQKTLLDMTPSQREKALEAHMNKLYAELGWED
jgi:hypothetical protein